MRYSGRHGTVILRYDDGGNTDTGGLEHRWQQQTAVGRQQQLPGAATARGHSSRDAPPHTRAHAASRTHTTHSLELAAVHPQEPVQLLRPADLQRAHAAQLHARTAKHPGALEPAHNPQPRRRPWPSNGQPARRLTGRTGDGAARLRLPVTCCCTAVPLLLPRRYRHPPAAPDPPRSSALCQSAPQQTDSGPRTAAPPAR